MKLRIEIPKGRGLEYKIAVATLKKADIYQITTTKNGTFHSGDFDTINDELFVVCLFCSMLDTSRFFVEGKPSSNVEALSFLREQVFKGGDEKGMWSLDVNIDFKKGITSCFVGRKKTGDELLQEIKAQINRLK